MNIQLIQILYQSEDINIWKFSNFCLSSYISKIIVLYIRRHNFWKSRIDKDFGSVINLLPQYFVLLVFLERSYWKNRQKEYLITPYPTPSNDPNRIRDGIKERNFRDSYFHNHKFHGFMLLLHWKYFHRFFQLKYINFNNIIQISNMNASIIKFHCQRLHKMKLKKKSKIYKYKLH